VELRLTEKIYKVTPEGQKSVFFEPRRNTSGRWRGRAGHTFLRAPVTTARIFRESRQMAKDSCSIKSDEAARAVVAFDTKEICWWETDPDGLILRIEPVRKIRGDATAGGRCVRDL